MWIWVLAAIVVGGSFGALFLLTSYYAHMYLQTKQLLVTANKDLAAASQTSDELAEMLSESRDLIALAVHAPKPMKEFVAQRMAEYLNHYGIEASVEYAGAAASDRVH